MTNGGPVFVDVKDGKIIPPHPDRPHRRRRRVVDHRSQGPEAHSRPRKTTLAPHGQNVKSIVYSPDRLLYPMKRVDFDPNGERNPAEPRQVRLRPHLLGRSDQDRHRRNQTPEARIWSRRDHLLARLATIPGAISATTSPALFRFANAVGMTRIHHNPDLVGRLVLGRGASLGVTRCASASRKPTAPVEDCLQNCDMVVFWAADPETTSGSYGAQEGTTRRQWMKNPKLGIKVVHVDPYYNASAQFLPGKWFAPKPTTSVAMAMAIAYRVDQGRPLRQSLCRDPHGRLRQVEGLSGRRRGRHSENAPSGRNRKPASRPKTSARWRAEWGKKRVYLAPGGWGQRPRRRLPQPDRHPVGARDGVPLSPCKGSASPASIWATCNGARRSTSISISQAMPTAACRAIWKTRRCRSSFTSACRNYRR